jgi:hypothetical protein
MLILNHIIFLGGNLIKNLMGVQIREWDDTRGLTNLLEKKWEIEYLYLQKLVCLDLINIPIAEKQRKYGLLKVEKDLGRHWLYVVKDNDFVENRSLYSEVICIIHNRIGEYLAKEYGFNPTGNFYMDSHDKVYINSPY